MYKHTVYMELTSQNKPHSVSCYVGIVTHFSQRQIGMSTDKPKFNQHTSGKGLNGGKGC